MRFPTVSGKNLEGRSFQLPQDFEGDLNIVLVGFQIWHQQPIDTWIPAVKQLVEQYPSLRFYEVPVAPKLPQFQQSLIDGGMRASIPQRATREITITLYTDLVQFCQALAIPNIDDIDVLVVNRTGDIISRVRGGFTPDKLRKIAQSLTV
jgi:hypothetical protein